MIIVIEIFKLSLVFVNNVVARAYGDRKCDIDDWDTIGWGWIKFLVRSSGNHSIWYHWIFTMTVLLVDVSLTSQLIYIIKIASNFATSCFQTLKVSFPERRLLELYPTLFTWWSVMSSKNRFSNSIVTFANEHWSMWP